MPADPSAADLAATGLAAIQADRLSDRLMTCPTCAATYDWRDYGDKDRCPGCSRAEAAERRVAELEAAVRVYADHRHWAIQRNEMRYPRCVWVGPGADQTVPDGPQVARAALEGGSQ